MTINLSNGFFKNNQISIICAHDEIGFCASIEMDNQITINFECNTKDELQEKIATILKYNKYATSIKFDKFNQKNWY